MVEIAASQDINEYKLGLQFLDLANLPNAPFRALHFIFSRTLRFNKTGEKIPLRHFQKGVYDAQGNCVQAGIPGNHNTITKSLERLEALGIISIQKAAGFTATFIQVNVDLIEKMVKNMRTLREPKKQKASEKARLRPRKADSEASEEVTKSSPPLTKSSPCPVRNRHHNYRNKTGDKEQEKILASRREGQDSENVEEKINAVTQRHRKKREATLTRKEPLTGKAFREVWNAALAEYTRATGKTGLATVSPKDAGSFIRSMSKASPLGDDWKVYVQDVVKNWDSYVDHFRSVFSAGSMDRIPEAPTFAYFRNLNARHFRPYYLQRQTGKVERLKQHRAQSVQHVNRKLEKAEDQIEALKEEIETLKRREGQVRQEEHQKQQLLWKQLKALESGKPKKERAPKVSDEEFERAMTEELPATYDEAVRQQEERRRRNA
jgi:hypothetical protein